MIAEAINKLNPNDQSRTNPWVFSLKIGFFAGFFWGLLRWLATGLNFTEVTQAFLIDPFLARAHLGHYYWQTAGWLAFILMSIAAAIVYQLLLRKLKGPWPGLLFGAVWWGIFYIGLGPLIGAVPPIRVIGWNSIVTDLSIYLMWGLFIGYSIAFEFHNEFDREPKKKE